MFRSVRSSRPIARVCQAEQRRTAYGCTRIGNRDVVGFGTNGQYVYKDDAHFPFPAIRFMENNAEICRLRQREMCDWRQLTCYEKKCLYRASFCCTFAEFQKNTGAWKFIVGCGLTIVSFAFWLMVVNHLFIRDVPESVILHLSEERQADQLRRMLEIRTNPIDGLSSRWDYVNDCWK